MGYSTTQIEVKKAKKMTATWVVFEASGQAYFDSNAWRRQVVSADIKDDGKIIFFKLGNGDFVSVEKGE